MMTMIIATIAIGSPIIVWLISEYQNSKPYCPPPSWLDHLLHFKTQKQQQLEKANEAIAWYNKRHPEQHMEEFDLHEILGNDFIK